MKLSEIFSNYFTVRAEMMRAVENLSQEQLDWTGPHHPASVGRLLAHIADCEFFWIGHVAAGKPGRPDFSRFENARTLEEIIGLLREQERAVTDFLETNDLDDWDQVFDSYQHRDGSVEKLSRRWLIWHVVEHQARHRGQIFMLMRTQGIEVPDV